VTRLHHISDREIEIFASVTWNGAQFDDRLRLRFDRNGNARIARKHSRPHGPQEVVPRSGY
jgi:hypothetical protein